jgi:dienelactone hydrolase
MANTRGMIRVLLTICTVAAAALAGVCAPKPGEHPALMVSVATALADTSVQIKVTGLRPGEQVTITSTASDSAGMLWTGRATFAADGSGVVDPATQAPESGTYQGVDAMGLFWSMDPAVGNSNASVFGLSSTSLGIDLTVTGGGSRLASEALTRLWTGPGVTSRVLTLQHDKVIGTLYLPAPGGPSRPGVLVFGGSEGGESQDLTAELLASHGYPALSLGYFALPGLPAALENVPLEYFATAGRILAATPGVDPAHILTMGYSRGSEAALLLADGYPQLFHGAIVYSPSSMANGGFPDGAFAWTLGGEPVQPGNLIPVNAISGPVLAIAGQGDQLWDSPGSANVINEELTSAGDRYPHQDLTYPNAGHLVGTFPYLPAGTDLFNPTNHMQLELGGTRQGDDTAQQAGWARVLALLASV